MNDKLISLGAQEPTSEVKYYYKDSRLSPRLAHQLMDLGVNVHTERSDDWFWETFDE